MQSSTSAGSRAAFRSRSESMQWATMSSGRVRLKVPRKDFASPVRTLSTTTTSRMVASPDRGNVQEDRWRRDRLMDFREKMPATKVLPSGSSLSGAGSPQGYAEVAARGSRPLTRTRARARSAGEPTSGESPPAASGPAASGPVASGMVAGANPLEKEAGPNAAGRPLDDHGAHMGRTWGAHGVNMGRRALRPRSRCA